MKVRLKARIYATRTIKRTAIKRKIWLNVLSACSTCETFLTCALSSHVIAAGCMFHVAVTFLSASIAIVALCDAERLTYNYSCLWYLTSNEPHMWTCEVQPRLPNTKMDWSARQVPLKNCKHHAYYITYLPLLQVVLPLVQYNGYWKVQVYLVTLCSSLAWGVGGECSECLGEEKEGLCDKVCFSGHVCPYPWQS